MRIFYKSLIYIFIYYDDLLEKKYTIDRAYWISKIVTFKKWSSVALFGAFFFFGSDAVAAAR